MRWPVLVIAPVLAVVAAGCAGNPPPDPNAPPPKPTVTSVEVAELEVSEVGINRFASCPPPGELGQRWIPPIPPWTAFAASAPSSLGATRAPEAPASDDAAPQVAETPRGDERGRAELVLNSMRTDFRRCYERALFRDPTQDGHVALALRVDQDGRVAKVETYGACNLSGEAVACMKEAAEAVHFAPTGKADTVVVPMVFAADGRGRSSPRFNDPYAADAFVTVETARPALHACAQAAKREGKAVSAHAAFLLDVDAQGRVAHVHVDNFTGDREVLTCAADALAQLVFPVPPAGRGQILSRIAINPRLGTR